MPLESTYRSSLHRMPTMSFPRPATFCNDTTTNRRDGFGRFPKITISGKYLLAMDRFGGRPDESGSARGLDDFGTPALGLTAHLGSSSPLPVSLFGPTAKNPQGDPGPSPLEVVSSCRPLPFGSLLRIPFYRMGGYDRWKKPFLVLLLLSIIAWPGFSDPARLLSGPDTLRST